MTTRLIALCSPAMASGKSTVANHLVERHRFAKISFAAPIKTMVTALLEQIGIGPSLARRMVDGDLKESSIYQLGVTPRHMLQTIGTEWGRNCIRADLWVHIAMLRAQRFMDSGISVVIDDMRFPNEYEAVQAAGGDCYRVARPSATVTIAHASEGQLDAIVMPEIWNTSTIDDLHAAVDRTIFSI
jgi:hypothetical protein